MHRLFPEKLVTIITTDVLEDRLVASVRACGASGYTIVRARGAGSSGEQSGMLNFDTNIKFHVIVPSERLACLLDAIERLLRKGHHLTVYVSDVSVMRPEKFQSPLT
jgi:nitrogen regulatory protein PII